MQTLEQRVSDVAMSLIRTYVPVAVAAALAWLATRFGIVVPEGIAGEAVGWIVAGLAATGWHGGWSGAAVSGARPGWHAGWGRWMLGGVVRQPVYDQIQ
jgi:hypothetical protein